MTANLEAIIAHYVGLRDQVAEIEAKHKEELAPLKADMQMIESALLVAMQEANVTSFKSTAGTAFRQEATSVKVRDWEDTLERIREKEAWNLLEARVSKTAYMELGEEWPGVEVNRVIKVNVRRPTA